MTVSNPKSPFRIGIDIDNVISDSYPHYLKKFNSTYNTNILYEEITDFYYLEKYRDKNQKELHGFIDTLVVDENFQLSLPVYPDASNCIKKWSNEGKSIHYITARPQKAYKSTLKWLKNNGFWVKGATLDMFDEINHTKDYEFKKEVVAEKNIHLLLEDSVAIANAVNIPVILFDRPWNKGKLRSNIHRLKNWKEVCDFVKKFDF
jgi:uncharacterized HAD superfamily protein